MITISVCIATYKRPKLLAKLLEAIEGLAIPIGNRIDAIVVDNDPDMSAKTTVERIKYSHCIDLYYYSEITPGISAARNRCIQETSSDFIAFINEHMGGNDGIGTKIRYQLMANFVVS